MEYLSSYKIIIYLKKHSNQALQSSISFAWYTLWSIKNPQVKHVLLPVPIFVFLKGTPPAVYSTWWLCIPWLCIFQTILVIRWQMKMARMHIHTTHKCTAMKCHNFFYPRNPINPRKGYETKITGAFCTQNFQLINICFINANTLYGSVQLMHI